MGQNIFYKNFQPIGDLFGNFWRAIWGKAGNKFRVNNQQYFSLNQKTLLIDTSVGELMKVAMNVPHLNTVISTGAELFSQMIIKHVDKNGEEIPNSKVLQFLKKPNPLQTQDQYLYEWYVQNAVYNKTFQYKINKLGFEKLPAALWILPSGAMKINVTGKIYRQTDINEIVESYEMFEDNQKFEADKIIYMSEGLGHNPLNPVSRIESLQIPLSNIVAALKSTNIIITERGMIGFISSEQAKDSDSVLPLSDEEHEKYKKEYQDIYSLNSNSGHVAFFKHPMKWNPMTIPVADLMLLEIIESSFSDVIASLRHDRDIYPSVKGATFENKSAGLRATIQNGIIPEAEKLMEQLSRHLLENEDEQLVACYDHLPCMQEDELKKAQTASTNALMWERLFDKEIITAEQFAEYTEVDYDPTTEAGVSASQKNLRGLVGSVTGIVQINQSVAQGFIDRPTAINILRESYGYDDATANSMITNTIVDPGKPAPTTELPKDE